MKIQFFVLPAVLILGTALTLSASAQPAAQPSQDLMPPVTAQSAANPTNNLDSETHPTLNLMPDKSELVRLDARSRLDRCWQLQPYQRSSGCPSPRRGYSPHAGRNLFHGAPEQGKEMS